MDQPVSAEIKQARMKEFMQLLPLTLELAGLPKGDPLRPFNSDQMEGRALSVRAAYKIAKTLLKEVGDGLQ